MFRMAIESALMRGEFRIITEKNNESDRTEPHSTEGVEGAVFD